MTRAALLLILSLSSDRVHAQSLPGVCESWIHARLGLSSQEVARIDPRSVPDADFFYWMRTFATATPPAECAGAHQLTLGHFGHFLRTRWTHLLTQNQLDTFSIEWAGLAGSWSGLSLPPIFSELAESLTPTYLERIRIRLEGRLSASPWASWLPLLRTLELLEWSPEWSRDLGAPAAAAIDLDHGRVALNIGSADPAELEVLLFHELAHAAHWQTHARGREHLAENEIAAWSQTFRFAQFLRRQGVEIPMLLVRAEQMQHTVGITAFAEGALRSRGLDTWRP